MENLERILRNRNKENVDFPLFGTSSSQDLYNIAESEWGTSVEILLTKSKSESDLKKVEVSPSRLESYILDTLWLDLETSAKYKKVVPVFQNAQFHNPPLAPNRPTPTEAARFAPLALPVVLHDLPLNYVQIISLYDGEGNVSAKYHVGKFDDFVDLEEVDYEDVKMRLFA